MDEQENEVLKELRSFLEELSPEEHAMIWQSNNIVALMRIYDALLTLLAATAGKEIAEELQEAHERGDYLFPPPQ